MKHEELWLAWSKKNDGFCGKVGLDVFYFPTLRRFCHDVITALMYDDSSTSFRADSSDEDFVDETLLILCSLITITIIREQTSKT